MFLSFLTRPRAAIKKRATPTNYGFRLTPAGAIFIAGTALIGVAAVDADINLLLAVFGLCLGCLLINALYGRGSLRNLTIKRVVPESVSAGQPFAIRYNITNRRRWGPARCILIQDEIAPPRVARSEAFIPFLAAGESTTITVRMRCRDRGRLRFKGIRLSSRFPFFLFRKWARHGCEDEVVVFPRLGKWTGEWEPSQNAGEPAENGPAHRMRGDEEVYGLREYRAGDNPRRIHWRRSARTGQLMIREMVRTESSNVWCVLSTRIAPRDAEESRRLETAISAAATFICTALERRARIGLICNGAPIIVLPPASGRACRPRLLRELAIRSPKAADPLAHHLRRMAWPPRWRGRCWLFSASDSEDLRETRIALARALGPVSVCVPGLPGFSNSVEFNDGDEDAARRHSTPTPPEFPSPREKSRA